MNDRKIMSNLADNEVPTNEISTSKYNLVTFLPKNLLEQFSRLANLYFLVKKSIFFFLILNLGGRNLANFTRNFKYTATTINISPIICYCGNQHAQRLC